MVWEDYDREMPGRKLELAVVASADDGESEAEGIGLLLVGKEALAVAFEVLDIEIGGEADGFEAEGDVEVELVGEVEVVPFC